MNDSPRQKFPRLFFPGAIGLVGAFIITVMLSACGNRGALYLKDADEERSQPGHELIQDTEKKDKRK